MEICVDSLESAKNAVNGGATRLSLCTCVTTEGLTPTPGFVKLIRKITSVPIYVMICLHAEISVYDRDEMDAMLYDLKILKDLGINGFVFGALTKDLEIDVNYCKEIISMASPLPVTFHRAFDMVIDPFVALETLIDLGFERILTAGQKNTAQQGMRLLRKLVDRADGRISIMPGSGIDPTNLLEIKMATKAKEFHASAKTSKRIVTKNNWVCYGAIVTDSDLVRQMVEIITKEK